MEYRSSPYNYMDGTGKNSCRIVLKIIADHLIVQCGLKSQLVYIYMCATSVTLRNAI